MPQERTILYAGAPLRYLLEQKPVKNLNLRIHRDGSVFVSGIDKEKADKWLANGAQPTDTVKKLLKIAAEK